MRCLRYVYKIRILYIKSLKTCMRDRSLLKLFEISVTNKTILLFIVRKHIQAGLTQ